MIARSVISREIGCWLARVLSASLRSLTLHEEEEEDDEVTGTFEAEAEAVAEAEAETDAEAEAEVEDRYLAEVRVLLESLIADDEMVPREGPRSRLRSRAICGLCDRGAAFPGVPARDSRRRSRAEIRRSLLAPESAEPGSLTVFTLREITPMASRRALQ
jgi:hypothetical protein